MRKRAARRHDFDKDLKDVVGTLGLQPLKSLHGVNAVNYTLPPNVTGQEVDPNKRECI